jgi:hypothetical protein
VAKAKGGVFEKVENALLDLREIDRVVCSRRVDGYKGREVVVIPPRWQPRCLQVRVCDHQSGERTVFVYARKPAAIHRLLVRALAQAGVACEA